MFRKIIINIKLAIIIKRNKIKFHVYLFREVLHLNQCQETNRNCDNRDELFATRLAATLGFISTVIIRVGNIISRFIISYIPKSYGRRNYSADLN